MKWRLLSGWLSSECGLQVHPLIRIALLFGRGAAQFSLLGWEGPYYSKVVGVGFGEQTRDVRDE